MICSRCSSAFHQVRGCRATGVCVHPRFRETARRREWRRTHPEQAAAQAKRERSTEKSKARRRVASRVAYATNPEVYKGMRAWMAAHPDRRLVYQLNMRLSRYGITCLDYATLLLAQWFRCAICEKTNDFSRPRGCLFIDHRHGSETSALRGLLCNLCNSAIGKLQDDPKLVLRAANYLLTNRE